MKRESLERRREMANVRDKMCLLFSRRIFARLLKVKFD